MIHTLAILPSLDEPGTVAAVTAAVDEALADPDALIVLADASPNPDTLRAFRYVPIRARADALGGLPAGKGLQVLTALRHVADRLAPNARVLLADTDTRNPDPGTYRALLGGLGDGAAIALADYGRFWDEGNLTNHLARPLIAAATGHDVPQPLAGDVAVTAAAMRRALDDHAGLGPELAAAVDGYGIDAFLVQAAAVIGDVTSVRLPATKLHAPSFPHLPAIFADAVPSCSPPHALTTSGASRPPRSGSSG
jgi:hypothetical protein